MDFEELTQNIKEYESDSFSATRLKLTDEQAKEIAKYMIKTAWSCTYGDVLSAIHYELFNEETGT